MATYILLSNLTDEGAATVKNNPGRIKEVNKELEELRVKVLAQYAVLGPYDFVNIVEDPDNGTIARVSAELARAAASGSSPWPPSPSTSSSPVSSKTHEPAPDRRIGPQQGRETLPKREVPSFAVAPWPSSAGYRNPIQSPGIRYADTHKTEPR